MPPKAPVPSISSVRAPSRAAAAAAAHPDGPPPTTMTSQSVLMGMRALMLSLLLPPGMDAKVGVMATEANPNVLKLLIKFRLFMFLWF